MGERAQTNNAIAAATKKKNNKYKRIERHEAGTDSHNHVLRIVRR